MSRGDPAEVAGNLVDPDHRLPGERESESSLLLDDALHWLQVYEELLTFKHHVLRTAEEHNEATSSDAVAHEVTDDQTVLETELARLERRLRFWKARAAALQPT